MTSDDSPEGDSFDERARTLNSNLQRLLEAVGVVLSASGDLLGRLQGLLSGAPSAAESSDPQPEVDPPSPPDRPGD